MRPENSTNLRKHPVKPRAPVVDNFDGPKPSHGCSEPVPPIESKNAGCASDWSLRQVLKARKFSPPQKSKPERWPSG